MATEAAWLECKEFTGRKEKTERAKRKRKTHLTHTGLLMEGVDRRKEEFPQVISSKLEYGYEILFSFQGRRRPMSGRPHLLPPFLRPGFCFCLRCCVVERG